MNVWAGKARLVAALLLCVAGVSTTSAQTTTGTVAGSVTNQNGTAISSATIVLVNDARTTRSLPIPVTPFGEFAVPGLEPGTYTIEVTANGFQSLRYTGVVVSLGRRVSLPPFTLAPGEGTDVRATSGPEPLQAHTGERSFAITSEELERLPLAGTRNFSDLAELAPGVNGLDRLGSSDGRNITLDGVSIIDTLDNRQTISINADAIASATVLVQGYQAEFGRSGGLQIAGVTRSGGNQIRGAVYDIEDNSAWNATSWVNQKNGEPKEDFRGRTIGFTLGGPVGKAGGNNRIFYFYGHEFRPSTSRGPVSRFRVPTDAERAGDFSASLDNNGRLFNTIKDPAIDGVCSATVTTACFADGGVLGRIPADRLHEAGLNLLRRYPRANLTQAPGTTYNLELPGATDKNLIQQPVVRVDYQLTPRLRVTGKYAAESERRRVVPGTMPGFNDVLIPRPNAMTTSVSVGFAANPTTFVEGTFGFSRSELASGGLPANASASLSSAELAGLALLVPDAGEITGLSEHVLKVMNAEKPAFWDANAQRILLPPSFAWGSRIGTPPPNQQFPDVLSYNRTRDVAASVTKVAGRHTIELGVFHQAGLKVQNIDVSTPEYASPFGFIDFGNDSNNPFDTGFGFANAAIGAFSNYVQQTDFQEATLGYRHSEGYIQDQWNVTNRFTVDIGVRATRPQPAREQSFQASNFFPTVWTPAEAPLLYMPGCSNGAARCTGDTVVAVHPLSGQILTFEGVPSSRAAIGTLVPDSGNPTNGIRGVGDDIAVTGYEWPRFVFSPRVNVAYDLTGRHSVILRGGMGRFYDRPGLDTVLPMRANAPSASAAQVRYGNLESLQGVTVTSVPTLHSFQYDPKVPSSLQWNGGVQMALPWASTLDVSYVGQRGFDRLGVINLNAVDIGTAYLDRYQDPTQAPSAVPGQTALPTALLRPLAGLGAVLQQSTAFYEESHAIQSSFTRRMRNGLAFGINHTLGLVHKGNLGLTKRLVHDELGFTTRSDQDRYEELNSQLDLRRHTIRGYWIWDLPDVEPGGGRRLLARLFNDWRLAGVVTAGSGARYDLDYRYANLGEQVNLTGSPDYAAKLRIVGDLGSGCSDNQYAQFNVAAVAGPVYRSEGLESGRNYLVGCADKRVNLSLSRSFGFGGGREATIRLDVFNALNAAVINARQTLVEYASPTDQTILNAQTRSDGSVDPNRLTPANAGFGAATGAEPMRSVRLGFRFSF